MPCNWRWGRGSAARQLLHALPGAAHAALRPAGVESKTHRPCLQAALLPRAVYSRTCLFKGTNA